MESLKSTLEEPEDIRSEEKILEAAREELVAPTVDKIESESNLVLNRPATNEIDEVRKETAFDYYPIRETRPEKAHLGRVDNTDEDEGFATAPPSVKQTKVFNAPLISVEEYFNQYTHEEEEIITTSKTTTEVVKVSQQHEGSLDEVGHHHHQGGVLLLNMARQDYVSDENILADTVADDNKRQREVLTDVEQHARHSSLQPHADLMAKGSTYLVLSDMYDMADASDLKRVKCDSFAYPRQVEEEIADHTAAAVSCQHELYSAVDQIERISTQQVRIHTQYFLRKSNINIRFNHKTFIIPKKDFY